MSKHETPLTLAYWERVGGTLIEEFHAVSHEPGRTGPRWIDAVILPDEPKRRVPVEDRKDISIEGKRAIVVQTKARVRLKHIGMGSLGQAFFSRELVGRFFEPSQIRSVLIHVNNDGVLVPIAEDHGLEVVIMSRTSPHEVLYESPERWSRLGTRWC